MSLSPKSFRGRIIVGHHAIRESLLVAAHGAVELWIREEPTDRRRAVTDPNSLEALAETMGVTLVRKSDAALQQVTPAHQGAILWQTWTPEFPSFKDLQQMETCTLVLLDGVEDPHNLGAILRTAWLMGVRGVYVREHQAVHLTPAVHKVASGACEHVPLEICPRFESVVEELKTIGFWVYALSHEASSSLYEMKFPEKVLFCLGAEEKGLRHTTLKLSDERISIPQSVADASYNVSVAHGIVLGERYRQLHGYTAKRTSL
jgi:23S rRNA (guanosine2251-2'-O)-methyltransferase